MTDRIEEPQAEQTVSASEIHVFSTSVSEVGADGRGKVTVTAGAPGGRNVAVSLTGVSESEANAVKIALGQSLEAVWKTVKEVAQPERGDQ